MSLNLSWRALGSDFNAQLSPLLCLVGRNCGKQMEVSLVTLCDPGQVLCKPVWQVYWASCYRLAPADRRWCGVCITMEFLLSPNRSSIYVRSKEQRSSLFVWGSHHAVRALCCWHQRMLWHADSPLQRIHTITAKTSLKVNTTHPANQPHFLIKIKSWKVGSYILYQNNNFQPWLETWFPKTFTGKKAGLVKPETTKTIVSTTTMCSFQLIRLSNGEVV